MEWKLTNINSHLWKYGQKCCKIATVQSVYVKSTVTIQISTGSGNTSISELALKAVLCGITQYSIRPKRSAIRAQAVYFLLSTMPSVTYLRLSDVSVSDALLIFSFQFNLLFFHISVARQHHHYGVLLDLIRNIGHWTLPQIWVDTFPVRSVQPSGKTELILTVKMETRHPIDGQFGSVYGMSSFHFYL